MAAQRILKQGPLRLLNADGAVLDCRRLAKEALKENETLTGLVQRMGLCATQGALALWSVGGEVVVFGDKDEGGNRERLSQVQSIAASESSFAALKADGSVVCWGDLYTEVGRGREC